jgi:hypothetical protein
MSSSTATSPHTPLIRTAGRPAADEDLAAGANPEAALRVPWGHLIQAQ